MVTALLVAYTYSKEGIVVTSNGSTVTGGSPETA
jgi:hypothetical protein